MAASLQARPQRAAIWGVVRTYFVERQSLFARIRDSRELPALLAHMTALSAVFAALYGLTVGLYAGGWQMLFNVVKFPMFLLATLALCVLALYVLNSLAGARLSILQTTAVVLSAILVTSTVLLALTPPLGFIMLTSLRDYQFVVLMNLLVGCLAGGCGVSFAFQATASVHQDATVRRRCLKVMRAWMILYGLVGLQMVWLFRPFFRQTDVFIRPLGEGGTAFEAVLTLLLTILRRLV